MPSRPRRRVVRVGPILLALAASVIPAAAQPPHPPRVDAAAPRAAVAPHAAVIENPDVIARAIDAMYNLDFALAHRVLDAELALDATDPLAHAARAAATVFAEFDRLRILDLDFFGSDDALTDKQRLTPDPAVRARIFAATTEARRLAGLALKRNGADRRALFATVMAVGVETQYTGIIEKRYIRGGTLSKEGQTLAEKMVALTPPIYDAYVTLGSIEYMVGNLNPVYRFLARMRGLRSDKAEAATHLQLVIAKGQYYRPYAKILLSVFYLREGRLRQSRALLEELRAQFPNNTLFQREIARLDSKISAGGM
jgi:hypothetical protein